MHPRDFSTNYSHSSTVPLQYLLSLLLSDSVSKEILSGKNNTFCSMVAFSTALNSTARYTMKLICQPELMTCY